MKIIFGLGNPLKEYEKTRHNIGFKLLDYLFPGLQYKSKFDGDYALTNIDDEKVLIVKPMKFINLSGEVIRDYINFYKVDLNDILVIHDDLDMDFGNIKITYNHSSGGHNGIKDIEKNIGTKEYLRLKIGISNDKDRDTKDYVLGKLTNEEEAKLFDTFTKLNNLILDFIKLSKEELMNKYNSL